MCGIGGIGYWDGREPSRTGIDALLDAQRHRGPDGRAQWACGRLALAHNRLSIIDLATGQQPMVSADGRLVIVYNGELYNFPELRGELSSGGVVFRTTSDTEVVLQAYARWGAACLQKFRGMYAFAIWDNASGELFLARDRLGIKPLYYWQTPTGFAFASELQGLLSVADIERTVDVGSLDLYLHYQYVPAPYTIYKTVRRLEPGCSLRVSATSPMATPQSYWSVMFAPDRTRSEDQWLDELDAVIGGAVRAHLISDVPFGAFLSGGVDSTIVAAHMSRLLQHPVQTFTVGFDEAAYDERAFAAETARKLGASHHEEVVHVDRFNVLDSLIFKLAKHYGEPFADSSAIPTYCVSSVAAARVKMVLSGDGGDELFAGYNTYPAILGSTSMTPGIIGRMRSLLGASRVDLRERALAVRGAEGLRQHDIYYAHFANERRSRLYRPEVAAAVAGCDHHALIAEHYAAAGEVASLSALQYLDLKTYLPGDILTKVDVAAMAHSLEVRVPLLDHHVVELAARIPPERQMFTADGTLSQKHLLKRYVNRLVGGDAFTRKKQGFGVPIDHWFRGDLYKPVRERILRDSGILHQLFERPAREELVASPDAAFTNAPRVWSLLFLQAWADVYAITI